MAEESTITIMGKEIPYRYEELSIDMLKYCKENPRIGSLIHNVTTNMSSDDLQHFIHEEMKKQPSVITLMKEIKRQGGLLEPILIRWSTREVIEGNSRLAAYRELRNAGADIDDLDKIKCHVVQNLTDEQQDVYLNQIHIEGKTSWSAYEKAHFVYMRYEQGLSIDELVNRFSASPQEIKKRIKIISLMKSNKDQETSHFSHYDVMTRNRSISGACEGNNELHKFLLDKIKKFDMRKKDDEEFTAQNLRDYLPTVLKKPKVLKKYMQGNTTLARAFENAKLSKPLQSVKNAHNEIEDITMSKIKDLENSDVNKLNAETNKLYRGVKRLKSMVEKVKQEGRGAEK